MKEGGAGENEQQSPPSSRKKKKGLPQAAGRVLTSLALSEEETAILEERITAIQKIMPNRKITKSLFIRALIHHSKSLKPTQIRKSIRDGYL